MASKRKATNARRITCEQAEALIRAHGDGQFAVPLLGERDFEEEDGSTWVHLYEGRTAIDGNFAVDARVVLVSGDLLVRGCLSDAARHDSTLLIVLGDVEVESAMFYSSVAIAGSLRAKGLVYANSLCDFAVRIGGDVQVAALIEEGSFIEIAGALAADHVLSMTHTIEFGQPEPMTVIRRATAPSQILRPKFLDDDYPQMRAIAQALAKGRPVLTDGPATPWRERLKAKNAGAAKKRGAVKKTGAAKKTSAAKKTGAAKKRGAEGR